MDLEKIVRLGRYFEITKYKVVCLKRHVTIPNGECFCTLF